MDSSASTLISLGSCTEILNVVPALAGIGRLSNTQSSPSNVRRCAIDEQLYHLKSGSKPAKQAEASYLLIDLICFLAAPATQHAA